ncbi:DUF3093 domain-containing protein [Auraticoccus monumenti]|uniref:DUF3093 domain-containing protein n=1 Tax=Auraticoccus monumenti TaxID=675864 RepID=A0A1G7CDT5_9ACTN|nr:DUF3093 domain-containing protein [Auraticoccus monumenti]SDE37497.1 Protein of unknown function [Auraticoccus monumenti]
MTHRERLTVPVSWVLLGAVVVGSLTLTCLFATPPLVALLVTLVATAGTVAVLVSQSAPVVADADGLRAGRSRIGWEWVAGARVLSPEEVQDRVRGRADVRCWRLLRPYLDQVVRIELADPADPHPAWLVASRHPEALAAAVTAHLVPAGEATPRPTAREDTPS